MKLIYFFFSHFTVYFFLFFSITQDHPSEGPPCDITEKQIFTMGGQIASAMVSFFPHEQFIHK